jgi:hypothetical protein
MEGDAQRGHIPLRKRMKKEVEVVSFDFSFLGVFFLVFCALNS